MKNIEQLEDLYNDLDYFFSTKRSFGRTLYLVINILVLVILAIILAFPGNDLDKSDINDLSRTNKQELLKTDPGNPG
jgi:hypothetical protein